MKPIMRMYQDEDDYWRIRQFLREVSLLNDRHDYSWSLLRWDYWVWHVNMNIFHFKLEDTVHLWEVDGQIVGMANPDSTGEVFFQVHPGYHSEELLCEMLDAAERLDDLRVPPGNRLEKLSGDRAGQHSIRINDQWRVCFEWREGDSYEVEIADYH